jgi:hypothetical protein
MKQLKLDVTDLEIDNAIPAKSEKCMITCSVKRDYGDRFTNIITDKQSIAMTEIKTGMRYKWELTPIARAALLAFDDGIRPKPFITLLRNPIVRKRRENLTPSQIEDGGKTPRLQGRSIRGARGNMPFGLVGTPAERRLKMGRDRFFGKRVFAADIAKLREQLAMPTVSA